MVLGFMRLRLHVAGLLVVKDFLPVGDDRRELWGAGVRSAGLAVAPAVGRFAVAIPAQFACAGLDFMPCDSEVGSMVELAFMAPDAVVLHSPLAWCMHADDIWFEVESEHEGMAASIHSLKSIFECDVIVWDVAVVANCHAGMRRPLPCGKLRSHDVAVHTSAWVIGEIRRGIGDVEGQSS